MIESVDTNLLTQIGIGGTFALIIIDKFVSLINVLKSSNREEKLSEQQQKAINSIAEINIKINEMYKWHDVKDGNGNFIWYHNHSLEKAIEKLADVIDIQTQVMQKILSNTEIVTKDVTRIEQDLKNIKNNRNG